MLLNRNTCFTFIYLIPALLFFLSANGHANETSKAETGPKVVVYYFHGDVRCQTCRKIEKLTTDAIHRCFEDQIQNRVISFNTINVDQAPNQHFTKDYQLYTRSVIVSDVSKGSETRWKNLQRVWELVHDDKAFQEYICTEITDYLK